VPQVGAGESGALSLQLQVDQTFDGMTVGRLPAVRLQDDAALDLWVVAIAADRFGGDQMVGAVESGRHGQGAIPVIVDEDGVDDEVACGAVLALTREEGL